MKKIQHLVLLFLLLGSLLIAGALQARPSHLIGKLQQSDQSSIISGQSDLMCAGHQSETVFSGLNTTLPTRAKDQTRVLYLLKDTNKIIQRACPGQYTDFVLDLLLQSQQIGRNYPFHTFW